MEPSYTLTQITSAIAAVWMESFAVLFCGWLAYHCAREFALWFMRGRKTKYWREHPHAHFCSLCEETLIAETVEPVAVKRPQTLWAVLREWRAMNLKSWKP